MRKTRNVRGWEFNDAAIIDDKLYYIAGRRLYYTDVNSYKTYYVNEMKDNKWLLENWVAYTEAIDHFLFFISRDNKRILRYDTDSGECEQIYEKIGEKISVHRIIKHNDQLVICCKDSAQNIIIQKDGTVSVREYDCQFRENITNAAGTYYKDKFFLFSNSGRDYSVIDLNDMSCNNYQLTVELKNCSAVGCNSNEIVLLDEDEIVIIENNTESRRISMNSYGVNSEKYGLIYVLDEKIILLPKTGNEIYEISKDGIVSKYNDYPLDFEYTKDEKWLKTGNKYYLSDINNETAFFARRATNYMLTINMCNGGLVWIPIERTGLSEYIKYFNLQSEVIEEDKFDIYDLVDMLKMEL